MATIHLSLDDKTLDRVRRLAEARRSTVEAVLTDLLERLDEPTPPGIAPPVADDALLGLFADDSESIDAVMASVYEDRENRPYRLPAHE